MKNLTATPITLIAQDDARVLLPACATPPVVIMVGSKATIDFKGLDINEQDQPYLISREVFDALTYNQAWFVTPDYDTALLNAFKLPHAFRRLLNKAGAFFTVSKSPQKILLNQQ